MPVHDDLFLIDYENGKYILYAPLKRSAAIINSAAVLAVNKYTNSDSDSLSAKEKNVIQILEEKGIIGGELPEPPVFPQDYEFCPHEVTLFLTGRCNLRCRYCYADAGHNNIDMKWEVAQAAIDLVSKNAGLLGSNKFAVGFHGGGEPTTAWDLLTKCVEYSQQKADDMGLNVEIFSATNGLLSQAQREYIIKNFASLNISFDGPQDIQDFNRPQANGRGSFNSVVESLKHFDEVDFNYGIRSTITSSTVKRITEIVEYLCTNFKFRYLHLEPAWFCGRCLTSGEQPPSDEEFIENFMNAKKRGIEMGINISYSGARLDMLTSKFCAAPGDNFTVLPEGIVSSCYEVTDSNDSRAKIFHYGEYDSISKDFKFNNERIARLRKLSVENLPFCSDCFCKWHCAGDCLAKSFEHNGSIDHNGTGRCNLNRTLTLESLKLVIGNSDVIE